MRSTILLAAVSLGVLACSTRASSPPTESPDAAVDPPDAGNGGGDSPELLLQGGGAEQVLPMVAARPDGTAWLAWYEAAELGGNYAVRLQLLDATGHKLLDPKGLKVSTVDSVGWVMAFSLTTHPSGDAILAYSNTTDFALRVQRFDAQGNPQWGAEGVNLGVPGMFEGGPLVATYPDGSVAVAYLFGEAASSRAKIGLQRILASGAPVWPTPKLIDGQSGTARLAQMVKSEGSDVILAWVEGGTGTPPTDAFVQRFDANGERVWSSDLKLNGEPYQLPFASMPLLVSDGAGGAYAAWHVAVSMATHEGYVQHITKDGAVSWQVGGLLVSSSSASHLPSAIGFMHDKLCVAWKETDAMQSTAGLYLQVFDSQGQALFGPNGLELIAADATYGGLAAAVRPTGNGAALFYAYGVPNGDDLFAGVAAIPFAPNPSVEKTVLSDVATPKAHAQVSESLAGDGYWLAWEDLRGVQGDIRGAKWRSP